MLGVQLLSWKDLRLAFWSTRFLFVVACVVKSFNTVLRCILGGFGQAGLYLLVSSCVFSVSTFVSAQ